MSELELVLRLLLATLIGGLIGMERESTNRPAGLRTHVLVTVGSALIMMISRYGLLYGSSEVIIGDPGRIAAGVVSGIGFLGAGTILQQGPRVKGLTTAASLWVCGGIGLAMGSGFYLGGIVTALISILTLRGLGRLEKSYMTRNTRNLYLTFHERVGIIGDVGQLLARYDILIKNVNLDRQDVPDEEEKEGVDLEETSPYQDKKLAAVVEATFYVKLPSACPEKAFMKDLLSLKGIISAQWQDGKRYHNKKQVP